MTTQEVDTVKDQLPVGFDGGVDGLEDVGAGDVLLPIIKIDHKKGVFVDSLSNEEFDSIDGIMLGLVKGRVLWPSVVEEGSSDGPICRSLDHKHGRPTPVFVTKDPSSGQFPSKVSKFDKDVVMTAIAETDEGPNADLDLLLKCGDCNLKEWETFPGDKKPWCSEQYTFPILRITEDGGYAPAYITFQRAALKACKAYISSFRQANRPMYTVVTTIKAIPQKRGNVEFVTPEFRKGEGTDPTMWPEFSENLADIRNFLTTPRVRTDDSDTDDEPEEEEEKPTPKKGKKAAPAKVIEAEVVEDEPEDDEPDSAEDGFDDKATSAAADVVDDDDEDEEPF